MKTFFKFQKESAEIISGPSSKTELTYPQFLVRFRKLLCLGYPIDKIKSCSFDKDDNKAIRAAFNIYKEKFAEQAAGTAALKATKEKEAEKPKVSEATIKPNPYFNYSNFKIRHLEMYPGTEEEKIKAAFEKYKALAPANIEQS